MIRGLHYGILTDAASTRIARCSNDEMDLIIKLNNTALPLDEPITATCMPEPWVKASMLVRLNSLVSGASGVRLATIHVLKQLIEKDVVPMVPIRGSISASGDLSPLSYISGLMQGKPSLSVWSGRRATGKRRLSRADVALVEAAIEPITLGAKEGLAIVNGTAVSAGVGALAIHEAHCLTALAQVLTAMSVEALLGTDESFDPFFASVRPHPGQKEAARNIRAFLEHSKLVQHNDGSGQWSLRQDRYSIRTAAQWIGPVLEDLNLAHNQVTTELNSVTDNPLVEPEGRILNGGNFQAKAVTNAMEKTRQGSQTIGRMLFAQCTELINPATNRGLPPNLVVNEPSESFIWKGTDIMIAALQSELGFLANPVGSHVQTAEMGNQALNSLALISGRYTLTALDVLSQLSAAHLVALCQALDLRVMNIRYLEALHPEFCTMAQMAFAGVLKDLTQLEKFRAVLWATLKKGLDQTTGIDSTQRFTVIADSLQPVVLKFTVASTETLLALQLWTRQFAVSALRIFNLNRDLYVAQPDATPFLGMASRSMYRFVRKGLSVPFLEETTIRTPSVEQIDIGLDEMASMPTIGSFITTVYQALRTGALYVVVMECLENVSSKQ